MNFHLRAAGQDEIANLGKDLKDSRALIYVLNQLDSQNCTLDALEEGDEVERATKMITSATAMGVEDSIGPRDLVKGNSKVNSLRCSHLQHKARSVGAYLGGVRGCRSDR